MRVLAGVIKPGEKVTAAQVRERIESLDLDRQRAIVNVLLTVTVLPGQPRGELRTDLLPITWKG